MSIVVVLHSLNCLLSLHTLHVIMLNFPMSKIRVLETPYSKKRPTNMLTQNPVLAFLFLSIKGTFVSLLSALMAVCVMIIRSAFSLPIIICNHEFNLLSFYFSTLSLKSYFLFFLHISSCLFPTIHKLPWSTNLPSSPSPNLDQTWGPLSKFSRKTL